MTVARREAVLVFLLAALVLPSCRSFRTRFIANEMEGLLLNTERTFLDEPSYGYGREAGAGLLKLLDGVIASTPKNRGMLELACRLNAQYAQGFIEAEDEDYARSLYGKALDFGLRSIDCDDLEEALEKNSAAVAEVLEEFDEDDVPKLFWLGLAYGGYINVSKDSVRAIANLPIALAIMERVIALDPTFFHGGAYLFKGQYYGSRGKELGGDPEEARKAIRTAIQIDPDFLLSKVFLARFYAVPTQNQELFERLLEDVLDAPDDLLPGESLLSAVAKHQAEELLFDAEDYFLVP